MTYAELGMNLPSQKQILDALTDGVLIVDRHWSVTSISPLCRRMLHITDSEIGKNLWCLLADLRWNLVSKVGCVRAAMEHEKPCELEAYFSEPISRWFHLVLQSSSDGVIVFARDITDLRELRVNKLQYERRIAFSDFVSLLAHRVNNPLQALTNLLLLARQDCNEPCIQELLSSAEQQLARIAKATSEALRLPAEPPLFLEMPTDEANLYSLQQTVEMARLQQALSLVPMYNALGGGC